jgi:hypothetical protein
MAHLQMDNGAIYEFGCKDKSSPYVQPTNMKFDQIFKRLYKSGNVVLGLTFDGSVFKVQNGTSTAVNTPMNGQIHDLAPNQVYGFFEDVK